MVTICQRWIKAVSNKNAVFKEFIKQHRQQFSHTSQISPVLSPTIQHSRLGAHGGLGDFVAQCAHLFPHIEWVLPLTPKIRQALKGALRGPMASLPVKLLDPVSAQPCIFNMDFYYHIDAKNHSLSWLIYNKDLLELPASIYNTYAANTYACNTYSGQGFRTGAVKPGISGNPNLLEKVHPLFRRYIGDGGFIDIIVQCAIAKAIAQFLSINHELYSVAWVHDWHFSALAGELLLTNNEPLISNIAYIQYVHNALFQGNTSNPGLAQVLDWPKHFLTHDFFNRHGQANLLGGALNIIKNQHVQGTVCTVSKNHALELTTVERGAGLQDIFQGLKKVSRLVGVNNPIVIPPNIQIKTVEDLAHKKPVLKQAVQKYFKLPVDGNAFILLWSHRFTQQKQIKATLVAIEKILSTSKLNVQFMFFCDLDVGSTASDVETLKRLIKAYPQQVAHRLFDPSMEMPITGGVDCSIMASFYEPFGYAPVWVAAQGGLVITAQNGGQVNIFNPDQAIWLNILPDVSFKRYSPRWLCTPSLWFLNNERYQCQVLEKNAGQIYTGIIVAAAAFRNQTGWRKRVENIRQRIIQMAESDEFIQDITALLNGRKSPAMDIGETQK